MVGTHRFVLLDRIFFVATVLENTHLYFFPCSAFPDQSLGGIFSLPIIFENTPFSPTKNWSPLRYFGLIDLGGL
jgi:hypothetical protein